MATPHHSLYFHCPGCWDVCASAEGAVDDVLAGAVDDIAFAHLLSHRAVLSLLHNPRGIIIARRVGLHLPFATFTLSVTLQYCRLALQATPALRHHHGEQMP